jgi:hypothetical protein
MIKLSTIIIAVSFLPFAAAAQSEKMETDRPSESLSPTTVLQKHFQVEAGFRREHNNQDDQRQDVYLYPSALLKYGLAKKLELRVLLENEVDYDYLPDKQKSAAGFVPIKIGLKYTLFEGKGLVPKTAVIARVDVPKWASTDFKADFVAPLFRLAMESKLTEKCKLVYNVGEEWEEDDVHGSFFYSVSPQLEITERLQVFAETYAHLSKDKTADYVFDAGFLYQFTPNFQFDAFAGVGMSKISPKNFVEAGLSLRLPH